MFTSSIRAVLFSALELEPVLHKRKSRLSRHARDGDAVFLIKSGLVKLTRITNQGSKFISTVVGPHQFAGEESLARSSRHYTAEAECLVDTVAYRIPLDMIERLFRIPEFGLAMLDYSMAIREVYAHRAELLAERNVEYRILYSLAGVAELVEPLPGGAKYPIPMTQVDVSDLVGATRETTSVVLSRLRDRGLLTLGRRLITTVSPGLLRKAADDQLTRTAEATEPQTLSPSIG